MLTSTNIRSRVAQIQVELSAGTIALEISSRNARVRALQNRWDRMRQVIEQRAASPDFAKVPGGPTGLLFRDLRCKDTPVYKIDTGILAELRAHEQQAAQELNQWQTKTVHEERKTLDATPVALATILRLEQLEELERKMFAQPANAGE